MCNLWEFPIRNFLKALSFIFLLILPDYSAVFCEILDLDNLVVLNTSEINKKYTLKKVSFFLDEEGKSSEKDILALLDRGAFSKPGRTLHRSNGNLWFYLKIKNNQETKKSLIIFGATNHFIWDFYTIKNRKVIAGPKRHGQDFVGQRPIFSRYPTEKVSLNPGEIKEYLIKVKTRYIMYSELMIMPESQFLSFTLVDHILLALYYGLMLALIAYNFFLFISTKEKSYLYYMFFAGSISLLLSSADGMADLAFSKFSSESFAKYSIILHPLSLFFANIFVASLLFIKRDYPKIYKLGQAANICLIFLIILGALGFNFVADLSNLLTHIIGFGFIILGIYLHKNGLKQAKYFLIGWTSLILGSSAGVVISYLPTVSQEYRLYFIYLGSGIEVILMSFALASKIGSLELEKSLLQTKEKEASKLQKLVNILCHDLSNPLNIINGQVHRGRKKTPQNADLISIWNKIERSCQITNEILKNVRDMEALKLGKLSLTLEPVSVLSAIDHVKFLFATQLEDKKIDLITNIHEGNDYFVLAEKACFYNQILSNIISNAIKFTNTQGKIEINAYETSAFVNIEIRDDGIGMPQDLKSNIFEETVQTNRLGTSGEKGTGFGLPLTKAFVAAFSGSISVESYPIADYPDNHGTKFIISLPISKFADKSMAI